MGKLGWSAVAGLGLVLAAGVTLIMAGFPDEGKTFTAVAVVGALALFGAKKVAK
jgi:hypothetical protein